ncbi:hypothetical protein [Ruminococcus sp. FC2018]|uniref:hypothetical protein n=1 Tax=Ruminococcus sp. FC2018 TaxID=1410617 RepID=UPI0005693EB9|nr:hypothetical protein [Ruminococcus sp. FC2018]
MNRELVVLLLKYMGGIVIVMGLILLACLLTPKIARKIDQNRSSGEEGDDAPTGTDPENYTVSGPFDPQKLEEYDLNYKIYNKDIYGVDFKHGKKQKRKDG